MGKAETLIAAPNARNVSALKARVRINRENKKYQMQEEAYEKILKKFYNNQNQYEILAKFLLNHRISIKFQITSSSMEEQENNQNSIVIIDQNGINSKLSDERFYSILANDKEILKILYEINKEGNLYLITADETAVSFVSKHDFVETVTVSYNYYDITDSGGYLFYFRLKDNWGLKFDLIRSDFSDFSY